MRSRLPRLLVPLLVFALALTPVFADDEESEEPTKDEKLQKAYDKLIEDSEELEGLLTLRKKEGKLYAELSESDLERQFLVFPSIARGVAIGRLLGGMMWGPDDMVLQFQKKDDEVLIVRKNIRFKAEEETPLAETIAFSYSDSVIGRLKVLGKSENDDEEEVLLVRLDSTLVADWVGIRSALKAALGSHFGLLRDRSHLGEVKNFPENMEIDAVLTFGGGQYVADQVPDGRGLTLTLHYSVLELPDNEFRPRKADDRVGHFLTALKDHSRTDPDGPYVRYVNRWHLEKADPEAKVSTVKKPVVFHLSKTIPYEYRPYVRQGILEWNKAFEKIGLLDAIEVRFQGKDEDWDPMDVRYNTIVWTSEAPFSGVGPSRAHPLTGQLLDADILYNASALKNMFRYYPVLGPREPGKAEAVGTRPPGMCDFQQTFRSEVELAAMHWLASAEGAAATTGPIRLPKEFLGASLRKTIIHEIGHVLGLRHNFKSSTVVPAKKLHDAEWTRKNGLTGSIMDYPAANIAPEGTPQGEYFSSTIGPYDYWAVEYAYSDLGVDHELEGEELDEAEEEALAKVASRSAEPLLAYGTDEDRWTGFDRNLDPHTQVYDLGDDPLAFAEERAKLVTGLWNKVVKRMVGKGDRYTLARYGVRVLIAQLRTAAGLALPYIGGQYHHRDHKGDPNERPAFVPVPAKKQREALEFLCDTVFHDSSFVMDPDMLNRLMPDHHLHWGQAGMGKRLDFPIHEYILKAQRPALARLTSPALLARMIDAERQVPADQDMLTAAELLEKLTGGMFSELQVSPEEKKWTARSPYISSMRRNLQRHFTRALVALLEQSREVPSDAGAIARHQLRRLRDMLKAREGDSAGLDSYSLGHLKDVRARVEAALEGYRTRRGL